jgi:hypothetical protein
MFVDIFALPSLYKIRTHSVQGLRMPHANVLLTNSIFVQTVSMQRRLA